MERAVDKNRSVRIETYAEKQIEITARKLARRYNLPATETEEIADAFRNVVERRFLATYDETKSSLPTYLSAFLSRQTPNVLRRVFAKKRGYFRRTSLEELLERPGTENASGLFLCLRRRSVQVRGNPFCGIATARRPERRLQNSDGGERLRSGAHPESHARKTAQGHRKNPEIFRKNANRCVVLTFSGQHIKRRAIPPAAIKGNTMADKMIISEEVVRTRVMRVHSGKLRDSLRRGFFVGKFRPKKKPISNARSGREASNG